MIRRRWTPSADYFLEGVDSITVYNGGAWWAQLDGDEWKCWEVLQRDISGEMIIETLKAMPQDWVPFQILHSETLPVKRPRDGEFLLPGWSVQWEELQLQAPPRQLQVDQLSAQQGGGVTQNHLLGSRREELPPHRQPSQQPQPPGLRVQEQVQLRGSRLQPRGSNPRDNRENLTSSTSRAPAVHSQHSQQYRAQSVAPAEQSWTPLAEILRQAPPYSQPPRPPGVRVPSSQHPSTPSSDLPAGQQKYRSSAAHPSRASRLPNKSAQAPSSQQ